uniref:EB domain-containing protein n=1 Tax=Macrostomum lignano TaxID=282301 RepID=A0A1I8JEG7_9PLAT
MQLSLAILTVVLVAMATGQTASGIDVCSQAECGCRPPVEKSQGRSFTKTIGSKMCEVNEECKTDGQCVSGSYCKFEYSTADASFASTGKCKSNCERKECPQFHECSISSADGTATCACSSYPCDNSVVVPICAAAIDDRTILRFNNTCLFINANCERKSKGLSELKSFVCMGS